jgi:hypothetical protein
LCTARATAPGVSDQSLIVEEVRQIRGFRIFLSGEYDEFPGAPAG